MSRQEQTAEGVWGKLIHSVPGFYETVIGELEKSGPLSDEDAAAIKGGIEAIAKDNQTFESLTADIEVDLEK